MEDLGAYSLSLVVHIQSHPIILIVVKILKRE